MERIVVDGMNVIGSRPTGWWRDRRGAARDLFRRLQGLAAVSGDYVTLVLDGRPQPDLPEDADEGVLVVYARRSGANAADERIIDLVSEDPDPESILVFTSDRALRRELERLGAGVEGATGLLDRLDQLEG